MSKVISKTEALPDGSMLWCVHHKGSYYNNGAHMSGTVRVDVRCFVLAKSMDEAKRKASSMPSVIEASKRSTEELQVGATIVTIESLVPARRSVAYGRMGSTLRPVEMSHPDDRAWKFAVCLIPVVPVEE